MSCFTSTGGCAAIVLALQAFMPAWSHVTPGEDPLILESPVEYQQFPGPPRATSGELDGYRDLPAWMRARISRYEAQAYADTTSIYTDKDVVQQTSAQGLKKVCVQEVASNSLASGSNSMVTPANNRDQIVVLRGDMVNVCR